MPTAGRTGTAEGHLYHTEVKNGNKKVKKKEYKKNEEKEMKRETVKRKKKK